MWIWQKMHLPTCIIFVAISGLVDFRNLHSLNRGELYPLYMHLKNAMLYFFGFSAIRIE